MGRLGAAGIVLVWAGSVSPVWSQVVQTSVLSGRVLDASGAVIRQADVTLRGPFLLDGDRLTLTDSRGRYRFPALLPGTYRLTAEAEGFAPIERGDIRVEVGEDRTVDFALPVGSRAEEVRVAARVPSVDVTASSIPSHLDGELLSNLPVSRELDDLINLVPGVAFNVAFGGTQSSNAIYVNGIQSTDPQQQFSLVEMNQNWLDQMEVTALGAGAEYGNFTGVAANAVVKSGGNRFSGLGEYWTTRSGWVGDNSPEEPREIISLFESTGQVGGPIIEDRLWFFGGADYATVDDQPAFFSGEASTRNDNRSLIARLDAALSNAIHLDGMYQSVQADASGVGLGPFRPLETTDDVALGNHLWNARTSWALTSRTLLEARTGGYTSAVSRNPRPPNTRLGPPPVAATGGGLSVSSLSFSDADRSRADVSINVTRFEEIAGQAHNLKVGIEFEVTDTTDGFGFNGGMVVAPTRFPGITLFSILPEASDETSSRRGSAFIQDAWLLHDRVTTNLGLRVDFNRGAVPERGTLLATSPVSPRVGVAWVATRDHATVVRAHYGRYHDSILTRLLRDLDPTDQATQIIEVELPDGRRIETERIPPPAVNTVVDDRIRHSYVDQYVVGVERELFPDLSVQLQYVRRDFGQFMGMLDTNTEWAPRPVRDPGPDGELDTGDEGRLFTVFQPSLPFGDRRFLYTNPDGAFRRYDALQLIGTKRYSRNWQLQASYTWARSEANVGNDESTNAGFHQLSSRPIDGVFNSPNGRINAEGEAPWTMSELKVLGSYRMPAWGGVNLSGIYRRHSGRRWGRFFLTDFGGLPFAVRAETRGTRRLPAVESLDLRVEKTFGMPRTPGSLGLFVDVLNLTNEGAALFVNEQSGRSFGTPVTWTDPRIVRAGVRYRF